MLQSKLLRVYKIPKFSKFVGGLEELTIEHVARYQIECDDLMIDEFHKMKYFPSSLTKSTFTWFTTLPPNSIYTWAQIDRVFHQHLFGGETQVSLIHLATMKRFTS